MYWGICVCTILALLQMVWADTWQVGCGVSVCEQTSRYFFVCFFSPGCVCVCVCGCVCVCVCVHLGVLTCTPVCMLLCMKSLIRYAHVIDWCTEYYSLDSPFHSQQNHYQFFFSQGQRIWAETIRHTHVWGRGHGDIHGDTSVLFRLLKIWRVWWWGSLCVSQLYEYEMCMPGWVTSVL